MFYYVKKEGLNASTVKIIAIIAMTVDHLAWLLFPGLQKEWYILFLHAIGRLTAPIMWYFIAEGSYYTKNSKKYILRLFIFAFISHFAFTFCFGLNPIPFSRGIFNQTSVMWSLTLGATLIYILTKYKLSFLARLLLILLVNLLSFPADWSCIACILPFFLYIHRDNFKKQILDYIIFVGIYIIVYFIFIDKTYAILQLCTLLSLPILGLYNGKVGRNKTMKWGFYIYYPAHMIIIGILRLILYGNINILF